MFNKSMRSLLSAALLVSGIAITNVSAAQTYGFSAITNNYTKSTTIPQEFTFLIRTNIQKDGWKTFYDDAIAGTTGQSKQIETISIGMYNGSNVTYRVHVAGLGWSDWVNNGEKVGTEGQDRAITGIEIDTDDPAIFIAYRVHVADLGWMEWVGNGERAGSPDLSKRIEAIQIKLIK